MQRTCIGCRTVDQPDELIRLVLGAEGEIVVDLHGGSQGRGAWVHPRPTCLAAAPAGLSRALRSQVRSEAGELFGLLRAAAARRLQGLLFAARRAKRLEAGAAAVQAALEARRVALVLVARDARDAASHPWLAPLVASGTAVAWGEKAQFGTWLSRPDTALLAVTDRGLAQEIRRMIDWTMLSEPSATSRRGHRAVSSEAG